MSVAIRFAPRGKPRVASAVLSVFLLLVSALGSAAWAASPDPVGRVTVKLNVVEAIAADGTVRTLNRTDPVFEGDTLRTGPRGRAQIRFTDRGLMSLRPASELAIDDYEFSAASPATARQSLKLTRGGFRTMTGRIADANRSAYRVSTPLAVIGVRGTIWDAYQEAGGALLLGVGQGGITATTASGEEAQLGLGASYNYVRVNPDGSVEFLIEPPAELDNSPEVNEEGDDDEEGAELGDAEDSSVAEGGGESESTAGTLGDSGTQLVETTNNPDNAGAINQANTGDGSLPTGGVVLSAADVNALINGSAVGIVAGVASSDLDANGEFILGSDRIGVGSGLAAFDANGGPLLVGGLGVSGFDPLFQTASREDLLGLASGVLNSRSGGPSSFFNGSTFQPVGGAAGVTWGSFAQPVKIFTDQSNSSRFVTTTGNPDILFAIGTPTDVANLTGTASYGLVDSRVATTGGRRFFDLFAEAFLDFGTGNIDGILDVAILETTTSTEPRYFYLVDWQGSVQGGLLTDVVLTNSTLSDTFTAINTPSTGEITGFLTGTGGEFLNLGFAFYVDGDPSFDTSGLALLQSGIVAGKALTPQERLLLQDGFAYVAASCCSFGTLQSRMTDPRASAGADAILGFSDALSVFDPLFNQIPANNAIIRRDDGVAQFYGTTDAGGSALLSFYELQGFSDGTGLPGGPFGVYDATTGALLEERVVELLVLSGRLADVASLTGSRRYTFFDLPQGFYTGSAGAFGSLVEPGLQTGADISFNVDFASAQITSGLLRVFTDLDDVGLDAFSRDRVEAFFQGSVGLSNSNPFVDFQILGGVVVDSDGDAGGEAIIDVQSSSMVGFFAGDGTVFNTAFSLANAPDPDAPSGFLESIDFVANAILTQQDLSLSAVELSQFQQGRVFVATACCQFGGGTAIGVAGDPNIVGGVVTNKDIVFGINTDALGEDLRPIDAGVLDPNSVENLVRRGSAFGFEDASFPVPPEIELVAGSITGVSSAGPLGLSGFIVDAQTGNIIDTLEDEVFYLTGFPSDVATLQAAGFTTFSGSSDVFAGGTQTLGGFATTNRQTLDPTVLFTPGASVSFNVDLANGQVSNGHLFAVQEIDVTGPFPEEFGFRVFFDGQVGYSAGNTFIDVNIVDGTFDEIGAIDIGESEIEIFLAGDGPANSSAFVALGAYNVQTTDATPVVASGTFAIGNALLPEMRLSALDALRLSPPGEVRLGIAAYSRLALGGAPDTNLPIGAEGLLLGRGAFAGQPTAPFLMGANALYVMDDGTGTPVQTNTARRGFYDQPFDFVLRKGGAVDQSGSFSTNVIPSGGADFSAQGFNVGWGAWQSGGTGIGAQIQADPNNVAPAIIIDREVFFASVNPTPQAQMPVTGVFSYGGAVSGLYPVLGGGNGSISGQPLTTPFNNFAVGFDVDFASGEITNGALTAEYNAISTGVVGWNVGFDGFVNGAVADLQVSNVAVTFDGSPAGGLTLVAPFDNSISGVFTGPAGQRFAGGFSINAQDPPAPSLPSVFESIQGVFVIDRN